MAETQIFARRRHLRLVTADSWETLTGSPLLSSPSITCSTTERPTRCKAAVSVSRILSAPSGPSENLAVGGKWSEGERFRGLEQQKMWGLAGWDEDAFGGKTWYLENFPYSPVSPLDHHISDSAAPLLSPPNACLITLVALTHHTRII